MNEIFHFYHMVLLIQTHLRKCKSFTCTLPLYRYILHDFTSKVKQDIFLHILVCRLSCYKQYLYTAQHVTDAENSKQIRIRWKKFQVWVINYSLLLSSIRKYSDIIDISQDLERLYYS